jgi:hypothetical protein
VTRIGPDYEPHASLEADVDAYLRERGYLNFAAPYHETFPKGMRRVLQGRDTWTALYLRGRADRVSVHPRWSSEFEWEAKTHDDEDYSDLCVELLPFLHHRAKASLAVKCMYVFRIPHTGVEGGFWVNHRPPVRHVMLTGRVPSSGRETFEQRVRDAFPEAKVKKLRKTRGSNDPFIIIDGSEAARCQNWRALVDAELSSASRR